MDEETVIEALKELMTDGEYAWKADELLEEEMKSKGYSDADVQIVRQIANGNILGQDPDLFARCLVSILANMDVAKVMLNNPDDLVALCAF